MSKYKPPCGVYFLYDKGEVVYVGQTNDIYRRISEHARGNQKHGIQQKEFDDWSYVKCDDEDTREKLEALLIKHILPKYNIDQKTYYKSPERYAETESREKSLRWNPNVAANALEERT